MKIALITLLFFLNNSTKEYTYEVSVKTNFLIHNKPQLKKAFSKNELITSYKKMGYKLIYTKNHKNKSINNCFFIFEHEIKDKDFKQNRILIVTKLRSINNYQILYKLDNIIYDKNYTMTCYSGNNKEAFNKIVVKGNYITVEQNKCTETKEEILHEFLTFKYYEQYNDYLLTKYSSILEQTKIGDDYSFKLLTNKEFGRIKLPAPQSLPTLRNI